MENTEPKSTTALEKPCLVQTGRGFSVSYNGKFLYSKYNPQKTIAETVQNADFLPGTLIIAASPVLWYGLKELLEKIPDSSFVVGVEFDYPLYTFSIQHFQTAIKQSLGKNAADKVGFLRPEEIPAIVNNICGAQKPADFTLPPIHTFKRAVLLEMSGGTQFHRDAYRKTTMAAENAIASFWKNRLTLTRLGRLFSRNLFRNLGHLGAHPLAVQMQRYARTVKKPILVLGAGESLEKTLTGISKSILENSFIMCVDAALPCLAKNRIAPDAVCAMEAQIAIEKAYIGGMAKHSIIFADMTSRMQVTAHTDYEICYFASHFAEEPFLTNLFSQDFFPQQIPPLGSVGLAAVYVALLLRQTPSIPVFFTGLDFSFSAGKTHARGTPAHTERIVRSNRLSQIENYDAAFKTGAFSAAGKDGATVFSDKVLNGYAQSFSDIFSETVNLYDTGESGLDIHIPHISTEQLRNFLAQTAKATDMYTRLPAKHPGDEEKKFEQKSIYAYLRHEEEALCEIKRILTAKDSGETEKRALEKLLPEHSYVYLHFPDGFTCNSGSLSFLKRIRNGLDFFLKDIRQAIAIISEHLLQAPCTD